ncbi:unnamed protein product [Cuscuta campestris]|uniref:Cyclin-dependent kinase inhibitor n=1 Tax=Cuscuta campestris TaxID=132261 RepID=A0A484NGL9_9ASTE|nr:unnamed protein product [Cuscuta campestris]
MGKHMREAKIAGDVAVMDLSQPTIGVRTRARTLALLRRQSSAPPPSNPDSSYLQLRSRRLPLLLVNPEKSPRRNRKYGPRERCFPQDPGSSNSDAHSSSRPVRVSSGSVGSDGYDLGMEASSNGSEPIQPRDDCLARREANEAIHSVTGESIVNLPSRWEMDEFFVRSEQQQEALFIDKYNYDIVNDLPLPGRYDWVKVSQ